MPESRRRYNQNSPHLFEDQKILIAGNQQIGVDRQRQPEDRQILGVPAGGIFFGIRFGILFQAATIFQPTADPSAFFLVGAELGRKHPVYFGQDIGGNINLAETPGLPNNLFGSAGRGQRGDPNVAVKNNPQGPHLNFRKRSEKRPRR